MQERGQGGISGNLLKEKAKGLREKLLSLLKDKPEVQLIGVGGISCFDDLWAFWKKVERLYKYIPHLSIRVLKY